MILEILSALQVGGIGILVWLAMRGRSVVSAAPLLTTFSNSAPPDHGVWDVLQDGEKIGSVRADSPAWFAHKGEGKTFYNPQTGETR